MTSPNPEQAFIWYLQAAENGHEKALAALSRLPVKFTETPQKADIIKRALRLWKTHAEAGNSDAQFRLGAEFLREEWIQYMHDEWEDLAWRESFHWLTKAADNGHGLAKALNKKARIPGVYLRVVFPSIED